jgi:hypothetical protein
MNKHRLDLLSKNSKLIKQNHLDNSIDNLVKAHEHLRIYLKGKNEMGLLTNILNSKYEIIKHLKK